MTEDNDKTDDDFRPSSSTEETDDNTLSGLVDSSIESQLSPNRDEGQQSNQVSVLSEIRTQVINSTVSDLTSTVTPIDEIQTLSSSRESNIQQSSIEMVVGRMLGTNRKNTTITYDWIPKQKTIVKITSEHAKSQLAILGTSEPTETEITDAMRDMKDLLKTVKEVANYHIFAIIIGQAQAEKITINGRSIMNFNDVSAWWASLTEEEARTNAEKMFKIQQARFESGKWSKDLEDEIMRVARLVYHKPPKLPINTKGCISTVIIHQRNCQTKNLTSRGKMTHGLYISVKPPDGRSVARLRRREGFGFKPWMLQRFVGKRREYTSINRVVSNGFVLPSYVLKTANKWFCL